MRLVLEPRHHTQTHSGSMVGYWQSACSGIAARCIQTRGCYRLPASEAALAGQGRPNAVLQSTGIQLSASHASDWHEMAADAWSGWALGALAIARAQQARTNGTHRQTAAFRLEAGCMRPVRSTSQTDRKRAKPWEA